jgi:hypothetical protein
MSELNELMSEKMTPERLPQIEREIEALEGSR